MSYILEALKKIEQKEQNGNTTRLLNTLPSPVKPRRKRLLPYLLMAALALNGAAMILWWFAPWRFLEGLSEPDTNNTMRQPVTEPSAATLEKTRVAANKEPAAQARASDRPSDEGLNGSEPAGPQKGVMATKPRTTARSATEKSFPGGSPGITEPKRTGDTRGVPASVADLPASVRASLPEFRISGHAYGPESRFRVARVNSKIVQEGESLSPGLRVDEILPDGIVFTYQGYRFKVGLKTE